MIGKDTTSIKMALIQILISYGLMTFCCHFPQNISILYSIWYFPLSPPSPIMVTLQQFSSTVRFCKFLHLVPRPSNLLLKILSPSWI